VRDNSRTTIVRRSTERVQSHIFETQIFNIFCAQVPIAITPPPQMGASDIYVLLCGYYKRMNRDEGTKEERRLDALISAFSALIP